MHIDVITSSAPGSRHGRSEGSIGLSTASSSRSGPADGLDLAVAVDLVMLQRGLTADEAHELLRGLAEATGRDLEAVASDVIDLGTSRLPR
ncbi:ANTAR domain-containing protein [Terrabacter sp. Ter38]|uniref:ANTAR domain-containing protein n=1 Tax=Terrabacter sp. Ter38 TaxID=2926030 RepID=UPI002118BD2D|nr:ANTAR domain-containing protein [Terrabacter sp. Ter38]